MVHKGDENGQRFQRTRWSRAFSVFRALKYNKTQATFRPPLQQAPVRLVRPWHPGTSREKFKNSDWPLFMTSPKIVLSFYYSPSRAACSAPRHRSRTPWSQQAKRCSEATFCFAREQMTLRRLPSGKVFFYFRTEIRLKGIKMHRLIIFPLVWNPFATSAEALLFALLKSDPNHIENAKIGLGNWDPFITVTISL